MYKTKTQKFFKKCNLEDVEKQTSDDQDIIKYQKTIENKKNTTTIKRRS